jgi:hypothetical protein
MPEQVSNAYYQTNQGITEMEENRRRQMETNDVNYGVYNYGPEYYRDMSPSNQIPNIAYGEQNIYNQPLHLSYQVGNFSMNRPNQYYSLEQARFQNRIKNASELQNRIYLLEQKKLKKPEKEFFASRLE